MGNGEISKDSHHTNMERPSHLLPNEPSHERSNSSSMHTDIPMSDDQEEDEIIPSSSFATYDALRSSRVWNRILSGTSCLLAAALMIAILYIVNKNDSTNDVGVLEKPSYNGQSAANRTSAGGTVSAKLNNATLPNWKPLPDPSQVLTKIAFGSCNSHEMPQPHWDVLTQMYQPDIFIMAGDNVYGDCNDTSCFHLRETYRQMAHHASVQGAAPLVPVFATLDDHDYGLNDCYGANPHKELARQLFAEFFSIPWTEFADKDGVYQSHIWGSTGTTNQRVQIILLDTRYSRSKMNHSTGDVNVPIAPVLDTRQPPQYANGTVDADAAPYGWQMLSERQWSWLEVQLKKPAELRLVVSSIQVLSLSSNYEAWRQLPHEQERLLRLTKHKSVVFVSGDIHNGALYEDRDKEDDAALLLEVTSSSLTHTVPLGAEFEYHCATPDECDLPDARRVGQYFIYENNFGSMDIDWTHRTFTLGLRRTETGKGSNYIYATPSILYGNAGDFLLSKTYSFPF